MDHLTFLFSTLGSFGLASGLESLLGLLDTTLDILGRYFGFFRLCFAMLFILETGFHTRLLEDSLSFLLLFILTVGIILLLGVFRFLLLHGQFNLTHDLRTLDFLHAGLDEFHFTFGLLGCYHNRFFHYRGFFHHLGRLLYSRRFFLLLVQKHIQVGLVNDLGLFQLGHHRRNMLRHLLGFGLFLRLSYRFLLADRFLFLHRSFLHGFLLAFLLG